MNWIIALSKLDESPSYWKLTSWLWLIAAFVILFQIDGPDKYFGAILAMILGAINGAVGTILAVLKQRT